MSPYDLRRYHPAAVAIMAVVTLGIVASLVYVCAGGGDPRPPTDVGSLVTTWTVCPSADPVRWLDAAAELEAHGLHTPMSSGPCDGGPEQHEVQIRDAGDQVDPLRAQLVDGMAAHAVTLGQPVVSGVIYVDRLDARPCTYPHELLHTHGIGVAVDGVDGHATAGLLARDCSGSQSWRLVDLVIAARTP